MAPVSTSTAPTPTKPSRHDQIAAIQRAAYCSRNRARKVISVLRIARDDIRRTGQLCELDWVEDWTLHSELDMVLPGNRTQVPRGSAQDIVSRGLLRPGEVFVHTANEANESACAIGILRH